MARVLNIGKKFSLASLGAGWEEAFLLYRPMTGADMVTLQNLDVDSMTDQQSFTFMMQTVQEHYLDGGQVCVVEEDGTTSLASATKDDLAHLDIHTIAAFYSTINGASADPKDSPKEQRGDAPHPQGESPTETS